MRNVTIVFCVLMQFVSFICRAENISLEKAVSIANKFLSVNAASWQIDLKKNPRMLRIPLRDSLSPTYYIFKGSDNHGFIVVSADDVARPVLGYSFDCKISDTGELPSGMQDWLDDLDPSYNLNGQRVNDNSSGLIIQNGRKLLKRYFFSGEVSETSSSDIYINR